MNKVCHIVGGGDFFGIRPTGEGDFIIAADKGLLYLQNLGITPNLVIGDFDSLGYIPRAKRVSRHPVNKDASDMELALQRAANYRHTDIYVYGGIGGRLDHTLANLQLFAAYSERGFYVTGIAEGFAIRCVTGPDVFTLPDNVEKGTVSVFAANDRAEGVIERGLEYSLDDEPLTNRTSLGLSNELIGQEATIAVESGTLYVFYPLPWETSEQPGI